MNTRNRFVILLMHKVVRYIYWSARQWRNMRCTECQEIDGRYSKQGARHDGHQVQESRHYLRRHPTDRNLAMLREALLNACINKDYAELSPIQIRVYENKLEIINGGVLPEGWTVETLLSSHRSMPYNPDIANTFFCAGEIEAWRRGIERIITACKNDGSFTPEFRYDVNQGREVPIITCLTIKRSSIFVVDKGKIMME